MYRCGSGQWGLGERAMFLALDQSEGKSEGVGRSRGCERLLSLPESGLGAH